MKSISIFTFLVASLALVTARAEEKSKVKEELKTLVQDDAKNKPGKLPPKPATVFPEKKPAPAPAADPAAPSAPTPEKTAAAEPPSTLPTVEVNKSKVTELNRQLYEQDKKIAREAKATKSTELDTALNGDALNVKLLGGESSKVRSGIAKERVELLQLERDLIETIGKTKNAKEKADLKKELEEIKKMRRELELQR
jgi:hypothetical protein